MDFFGPPAPLPFPHGPRQTGSPTNPRFAEPKKKWSLSEWIANFLKEENQPYDDETGYDDIYDDTLPDGDGAVGGIDESAAWNSLAIAGLIAALVFLLYYRNQRRQRHREEEERRRQQEQRLRGGQAPGQPQAQDDRAAIPPDDFLWPAGGLGL